jgi:hypothetical protein
MPRKQGCLFAWRRAARCRFRYNPLLVLRPCEGLSVRFWASYLDKLLDPDKSYRSLPTITLVKVLDWSQSPLGLSEKPLLLLTSGLNSCNNCCRLSGEEE